MKRRGLLAGIATLLVAMFGGASEALARRGGRRGWSRGRGRSGGSWTPGYRAGYSRAFARRSRTGIYRGYNFGGPNEYAGELSDVDYERMRRVVPNCVDGRDMNNPQLSKQNCSSEDSVRRAMEVANRPFRKPGK